jgi:hypothetical protein
MRGARSPAARELEDARARPARIGRAEVAHDADAVREARARIGVTIRSSSGS